MIDNDALICAECGNEICDPLSDWMMRDGESRVFHCEECGAGVHVTAHVAYETRPEH